MFSFIKAIKDLLAKTPNTVTLTNSFPDAITTGKIDGSILVKNGEIIDYGKLAGRLAVKYETGKKASDAAGYISNGSSWGDPGGDSYGSYQLETNKGTMQGYLKGNDRFTTELKKLKINSVNFRNKWKELAKQDPEGFEQSQFNYLAHKPGGHYDALDYARKLGWNVNNLAMQSAIFSTSNQSGGWKTGIFDKAKIKTTDSLETQINKLYDARAAYFKKLKLSKTVKDSIIKNRTVDERRDCLRLICVFKEH